MTIQLNLTDNLSIEVVGIYIPATPDVWYLRNGDPGHPGTDAEFDIKNITLAKGTVTDLLDWADGFCVDAISKCTKSQNSIYEEISELCIKQIESDDFNR